jgi:hypothetical protein
MHLHLRDSVGGHLYYATVKFEIQIYICIALLDIALADTQNVCDPTRCVDIELLL